MIVRKLVFGTNLYMEWDKFQGVFLEDSWEQFKLSIMDGLD